jgi:ABC-type ATPase with predicted acetyltransferase domain
MTSVFDKSFHFSIHMKRNGRNWTTKPITEEVRRILDNKLFKNVNLQKADYEELGIGRSTYYRFRA